VYNFILHYQDLNTDAKNSILILLDGYLNYISDNDIHSAAESRQLYYEYILPMGKIYKEAANFSVIMTYQLFVAILIIVNLILFFKSTYFYLIATDMVFVLLFYLLYRRRKVQEFLVTRFDSEELIFCNKSFSGGPCQQVHCFTIQCLQAGPAFILKSMLLLSS